MAGALALMAWRMVARREKYRSSEGAFQGWDSRPGDLPFSNHSVALLMASWGVPESWKSGLGFRGAKHSKDFRNVSRDPRKGLGDEDRIFF